MQLKNQPESKTMKLIVFLCIAVSVPGCAFAAPQSQQKTAPSVETESNVQTSITLESKDDRIAVKFGDELFTQYIFKGYEKPILYPVMAPGNVAITRRYPIEKKAANEATDHPHHKSIWFGQGNINGHNFWTMGHGTIVLDKVIQTQENGKNAVIETSHLWKTRKGKTLLKDETKMTFSQQENTRSIEYEVKLIASEKDLTFIDDRNGKEGTMAIRTHPALRVTHRDKGKPATGRALNSQGTTGKAIWGEKSKWVLYQGPINKENYAVAMFDHSDNLRHPTTWLARDYGLVAANPFGLSHFLKKKRGAGNYTLKKGESLTLKYLFVFTQGEVSQEDMKAQFKSWTQTK